MKQVLKGGIVVGGSGSVRADVLIDGEKVAAVGTSGEMERLADEDTQIVDVEGCLLFPGFIDAHYRGELKVILINLDPSNNIQINKGDRIAQLVIQEVPTVNLIEVEELDETDRGNGGFGSSGVA